MGKQGNANLNDLSVFTFSNAILLMSMRARDVMRNTHILEERTEFLVLPTPICLHSDDFAIKETFNKLLELAKVMKNFRFLFKKINPDKLAIIINKRDIIIKTPYRSRGRSPYI